VAGSRARKMATYPQPRQACLGWTASLPGFQLPGPTGTYQRLEADTARPWRPPSSVKLPARWNTATSTPSETFAAPRQPGEWTCWPAHHQDPQAAIRAVGMASACPTTSMTAQGMMVSGRQWHRQPQRISTEQGPDSCVESGTPPSSLGAESMREPGHRPTNPLKFQTAAINNAAYLGKTLCGPSPATAPSSRPARGFPRPDQHVPPCGDEQEPLTPASNHGDPPADALRWNGLRALPS